jgi:hypothetical protein
VAVGPDFNTIGMLKFSSVWFFENFTEPRTRLQVWSRQSAEPQTGPSVQVQKGFELEPNFFVYKKFVTL